MDRQSKTITFFSPAFKRVESPLIPKSNGCGTVALSVTGSHCHLNCGHCGKTILKHMLPALTPEELKQRASRIAQNGGQGILISGGSDKDGSVPLIPFARAMKEIKAEWGLKILVHTGMVHPGAADALAEAGIDLALLDIIGDDQTIRRVCGLKASVSDFERSLRLLIERSIPTAPHVIMGLHFGRLKGEEKALTIIRPYPIKALVMVGLRPMSRTAMAKVTPPEPEAMGGLLCSARRMFPQVPVVLGCERPLGRHRRILDSLALEAGLDGIAFPTEEAVRWAENRGLTIRYQGECCALIQNDRGGKASLPEVEA